MNQSVLLHEYHIPAPGVRKKVIYQFSDVHLTLSDALSDAEETEKALHSRGLWTEIRERFAKKYGEPYGEEQRLEPEEHFEHMVEIARQDGDALVIAGDLFDFVSPAHLRFFEKRFTNFPMPWIFACGNHEKTQFIPDDAYLALIKRPVQTLDLGDLLLVAINDSKRVITEEQLAELSRLLEGGKPILLAMHTPIATPNNDVLMQCNEYYHLNHSEAPAENFAFVELVQKNAGKILAVLAGHLHFGNVCEIAPGLVQYVSSQGVVGNLNRYTVGG